MYFVETQFYIIVFWFMI